MARILALNGTEICRMLSFARTGDAATAQVGMEDDIKLSARGADVWLEDDSGTRFRGRILGSKVIEAGGTISAVFSAQLYDE